MKTKILIILIVVILIAAGGVGYYFYKEKKAEESIDETADLSSKDLSTEGWKVYKDEGHGYKFKYLDDFYVEIKSTKISDFPREAEIGLSEGKVLNERDSINSSDIDTDCSVIGIAKLQDIKSYCKIKQFNQIKGKLQKYYIGEDPSFGMNFIFYRRETRISLSIVQGLPELYSLDSNMRVAKFNEYFDSVVMRDPANPDLISYDTFEKILSTLKFIEEDKITDWKIYVNEKYSFSFAYPRNFRLLEPHSCGRLGLEYYIEDSIPSRINLLQNIYTEGTQQPEICLNVVKTNKTAEQLLGDVKKAINKQAKALQAKALDDPEVPYSVVDLPEVKSVETIIIEGLKMIKAVCHAGPGAPYPVVSQYYITHPGYVFVFSANYSPYCSSLVAIGDCGATEKEILPKILSTFKFMK